METFFTQFHQAIVDYPETGMELTFDQDDMEEVGDDGGGDDFNVNEHWRCKITVRVNGWLDATDVVVRVDGMNDTKVREGPRHRYRNQWRSDPMDIASGHSRKTDWLYFRVPPTAGPMELLEAHIFDWNADFSSLQNVYSTRRSDLTETYTANVVGD